MAVYTQLSKAELADVVDDYGLVKLIAVSGIPNGSVNTNYCLETTRGRHLLRIDEVKGELGFAELRVDCHCFSASSA